MQANANPPKDHLGHHPSGPPSTVGFSDTLLAGGESPSRPGETVDYVENLSDQKKGGRGRFKSFLMVLVGADEFEFANPAALKKFFDERQASTHLLIRCEAFPKQLPPKDNQLAR